MTKGKESDLKIVSIERSAFVPTRKLPQREAEDPVESAARVCVLHDQTHERGSDGHDRTNETHAVLQHPLLDLFHGQPQLVQRLVLRLLLQ